MKHEELKLKVKETLKDMPESSATEIHECIGEVAIIQVHRALKELVTQCKVVVLNQQKEKRYTLIENTSVKVDRGGRDVSTYFFQGEELKKGRLTLRILQRYVSENKSGIEDLKELFPDELAKPYGLVQLLTEAQNLSKRRERFFLKECDQLQTTDGPACVCNQITKERIAQIIKIASETLGYEIK